MRVNMNGERDAKKGADSFVHDTIERRDTSDDPGKRSLTERMQPVQRGGRSSSSGNVDRSFEPYVDRSFEQTWIQRRPAASNPNADDKAVHAAAHHGVAGRSTPL